MRTVLSLTSITSGEIELFGGKRIEEVGNKKHQDFIRMQQHMKT